MAQKVEVSRGALGTLVAALVVCLVAVAFLLGRESAQPTALASPSPPAPPPLVVRMGEVEPEAPLPPQRLPATAPVSRATPGSFAFAKPSRLATSAVERPVAVAPEARPQPQLDPSVESGPAAAAAQEAVPVTASAPRRGITNASVGSPSASAYPEGGRGSAPRSRSNPRGSAAPAAGASAADSEAVRRYLSQIDEAVASAQGMDDPNAFATQLLQQSMQGDTRAFDQLIGSTEGALRTVQAIKPPARCKEHHSLMMGQLRSGIDLLRKVKGATVSMDAGSLAGLSMQGKDLQGDVMRLQQLDRELRSL